MGSGNTAPLHVVQVGYDDSVFDTDLPSDTLQRHLNYSRELDRQHSGGRMTCVVLTGNPALRRFQAENVTVCPAHLGRSRGLFRLLRLLHALHREQPISVVTTQTVHEEAWMALLFGFLHRVPVVTQLHYDLFSPQAQHESCGGGLKGTVRRLLAFRSLRSSAAVRTVGTRFAAKIRRQRLNQNVHTIPVPVLMERPTAPDLPARTQEPRVLFVGRLVEQKNLQGWLEVAARVARQDPEIQFEIVGDGPLLGKLRQRTAELGITNRVYYSGAVPNHQLPRTYQQACVFLLTSHYEGFGRVIVEAYLHGVPVVAPGIAGVEDIIEHGQTGFLHDPGDWETMAASVLRLTRDSALGAQMGRAGKALVEARFDPDRLCRQWIALLVETALAARPLKCSAVA